MSSHGSEPTIPHRPTQSSNLRGVHRKEGSIMNNETTYPGVGLLITLGSGLLFWGTVAYFIFR